MPESESESESGDIVPDAPPPELLALLDATREAIAAGAVQPTGSCPEVSTLDALARGPVEPRAMRPEENATIDEFLGPAADGAATAHDRTLARALVAASPYLRWLRPYGQGEGADVFAGGYTSTLLVGNGCPLRGYAPPFVNPGVLVSFTLQAPGLLYPVHRHRQTEIYHPMSGRARWLRGDEPWRVREPGEWFYHRSNEGHATRTLDEPLLCLAAWMGELDAPLPVLEVEGSRT